MQPRQRFFKPRTSPSTGFSLVEMLVVVAIIGLLAGLSIPAIGRAKAFSQQTTCTANLRTLHQATMLYASDFDGQFPPAKNPWNNYAYALAGSSGGSPGYVGLGGSTEAERGQSWSALRKRNAPSCFWCPAAIAAQPMHAGNLNTYAMNLFVGGTGEGWPGNPWVPNLKVAQVASPSKTALYMDGCFDGTFYQVYVGADGLFPSSMHPPNLYKQSNNPARSLNVVFVDGHVETRRIADIPTAFTNVFWTPNR